MHSFNKDSRSLNVAGNIYERSFQQGRALLPHKRKLLKAASSAPYAPESIQKLIPNFVFHGFLCAKGKSYLRLHEPILKNHLGLDLSDKVKGLSEGFGFTQSYLYGLNAVEIISSQLPYSLGCTSLAFASEKTAVNHPLIAYNHDFPPSFGPELYVRESRPLRGYASVSLTYPPTMGCIAGVNEKGLAVSLNHAFSTDIKPIPALLITLLVQECLDRCATLQEAREMIDATPVPNGSMITLVDKSGNRAAVELSCTKKSWRYPKDTDILSTFNQYQCPDMFDVEIPLTAKGKWVLQGYTVHQHNLARRKRFDAVFQDNKKYSTSDIHQLLSDHEGGEGGFNTICRHHMGTANTLASCILDPVEGTMKVIFGFPCQQNYKLYSLQTNTDLKCA